MQWVRDNLGMIGSAAEIEELAQQVDDNGGAYFVPAFSGLFAPHWRSDARGALVGLTRYVNRGHIARAVLEATAFQTREVLDAMNADSGVPLTELRVDGGMVVNETLMQFQADILGVDVVRPKVAETTALGAAYAAGLAVGYWENDDDIQTNWGEDKRWTPEHGRRRARAPLPQLEEGGHQDPRLGRRRRGLTRPVARGARPPTAAARSALGPLPSGHERQVPAADVRGLVPNPALAGLVGAELHGGVVEQPVVVADAGFAVIRSLPPGGSSPKSVPFSTSTWPWSSGWAAYCSSLARESAMSRLRIVSWPMRSVGPKAAFSVRSIDSLSGW